MQKFNTTAERTSSQMLGDWDQSVRIHTASKPVAVDIPLSQAKVSGVLWGLLAGVGVMAAVFLLAAALPAIGAWLGKAWRLSPWWSFPAGVVAGALVTLIVTLKKWEDNVAEWRELLWQREQRLGMDLDGDGHVGEPETSRWEVHYPDTNQTQILHFPVSEQRMALLARGLVSNGWKFTEREWSGSGKPFSAEEVDGIREVFLARGWCVWKNEDSVERGVNFTAKGKASLRGKAGFIQPPYPAGADSENV